MFVLGHVVIGSRLGTLVPGTDDRPAFWWMVLGTVLPDLLDKSLYYGQSIITGRSGAELGFLSGTRTIGHTALFGIAAWAVMRLLGKRAQARGLLVGIATHWLLDGGGELIGELLFHAGLMRHPPEHSALQALVFPLMGPYFAVAPFRSVFDHLRSLANAYTLCGELIGLGLLILQWRSWKTRLDRLRRPA